MLYHKPHTQQYFTVSGLVAFLIWELLTRFLSRNLLLLTWPFQILLHFMPDRYIWDQSKASLPNFSGRLYRIFTMSVLNL